MPEITGLLSRARGGDRDAADELLPLVYDELHRLARAALRRDREHPTLQPAALVNEAYLRLFGEQAPRFADRAHFLGIASRTMRQVLVDYVRTRQAQKLGSELHVEFHESLGAIAPPGDLLELDEALGRLAREDPRLATLIEMRFFAGMTAEEAAAARAEPVHAVRQDLLSAQARVRRLLQGPGHADEPGG